MDDNVTMASRIGHFTSLFFVLMATYAIIFGL